MTKNYRKMWRPKLPEMPEQCVSCPFRSGNDKEFGEVISRLQKGQPATTGQILHARVQLKIETSQFGDFSCHQSAYDKKMKVKPHREHKQCPGASANFILHGETKK